jgi:hypothetical protein
MHTDDGADRLNLRRDAGVSQLAGPAGLALVLEFFFPDGQPQQRGCPAMAGNQTQHQRRLIVMVEVGPVHRH